MEGIIRKALSGFYYGDEGASLTACRGRGKLRHASYARLYEQAKQIPDWERDQQRRQS